MGSYFHHLFIAQCFSNSQRTILFHSKLVKMDAHDAKRNVFEKCKTCFSIIIIIIYFVTHAHQTLIRKFNEQMLNLILTESNRFANSLLTFHRGVWQPLNKTI